MIKFLTTVAMVIAVVSRVTTDGTSGLTYAEVVKIMQYLKDSNTGGQKPEGLLQSLAQKLISISPRLQDIAENKGHPLFGALEVLRSFLHPIRTLDQRVSGLSCDVTGCGTTSTDTKALEALLKLAYSNSQELSQLAKSVGGINNVSAILESLASGQNTVNQSVTTVTQTNVTSSSNSSQQASSDYPSNQSDNNDNQSSNNPSTSNQSQPINSISVYYQPQQSNNNGGPSYQSQNSQQQSNNNSASSYQSQNSQQQSNNNGASSYQSQYSQQQSNNNSASSYQSQNSEQQSNNNGASSYQSQNSQQQSSYQLQDYQQSSGSNTENPNNYG